MKKLYIIVYSRKHYNDRLTAYIVNVHLFRAKGMFKKHFKEDSYELIGCSELPIDISEDTPSGLVEPKEVQLMD